MAKKNTFNIGHDLFGGYRANTGINSKAKGDNNERAVCKWLHKWTGSKFARVPSSGGLRWANAAKTCGDVICEDDDFYFPFSVETKHYKNLTVKEQLRSNSLVYRFWKQAVTDSLRSATKMHPLLLLRKNGMKAGEYYFGVSDELAEGITSPLIAYGGGIKLFMSSDILEYDEYSYICKIILKI